MIIISCKLSQHLPILFVHCTPVFIIIRLRFWLFTEVSDLSQANTYKVRVKRIVMQKKSSSNSHIHIDTNAPRLWRKHIPVPCQQRQRRLYQQAKRRARLWRKHAHWPVDVRASLQHTTPFPCLTDSHLTPMKTKLDIPIAIERRNCTMQAT